MCNFVLPDKAKKKEEEFINTFPTPLHYKPPKYGYELWVFWSHRQILQQQQQQGFLINNNDSFSADADTQRMISDKIKQALCGCNFDDDGNKYIFQFWAPTVMTIGGRRLLSTSGQPFAVTHLSKKLSKYRLRCMEYQYSIDDDQHNHFDDDPAMIISGAPTSTAFLNRFPEVFSFTNLKGASPLVDSAFDCGLSFSYMLPVCFPSQNPSCCVGVLELSITAILANDTIIAMIRALEEVGLGVFQVQERIPSKIIDGLKPAMDEIEQALEIVCESNNTHLAQVWIGFQDDNHVPFSSYLEATRKKQMLYVKLTGYITDMDCIPIEEYYGLCDIFPLAMGEDFVEKTLADYKPRFCNDLSKLTGDTLAKELLSDVEFSRLTMCLNSIHTGDFCYAFEFIWEDDPDYDVEFVEDLLLKLKELLPSFKLASGAELGDELDFIKVGDSTATETKFLKIFQGKRLSPMPEVLEEGRRIPVPMVVDCIAPLEAKYKTTLIPLSREVIEQQFGNTETEAEENL